MAGGSAPEGAAVDVCEPDAPLAPPPAPRAAVLTMLLLVRVADTAYALLVKMCLDGNAGGSALVFGLYRNAGAVPLMLALSAMTEGFRTPALHDAPHLVALAATAVFGSQACYLIGLKACNSLIVATALGNLTPVVSALLGVALGRETLSATKLLGVALAIGGSVAMVDPGAQSSSAAAGGPGSTPAAGLFAMASAPVPRAVFLRGCALLAASPICWASSLFIQKPLLKRYPPFSLTAWTFAIGTAAMAGLAAPLYGKQPAAWHIGHGEAIALVAAVLFGCVFKFCAVSWLNARVDATLLCIFETGGHVATMLLSGLILHERFYWRYIGAVPVFIGCLLVALSSHWVPRDAAAVAGADADAAAADQAAPQQEGEAAGAAAQMPRATRWWRRRRGGGALAEAQAPLLGAPAEAL